MEVGQEWVYRVRDMAPSERARIRTVSRSKRSTRVTIEILEGDRAGTVEDVPAGRLRSPWSNAAAYDALMGNWDRIRGYELDDAEEEAVFLAFSELIAEDVATFSRGVARNCVGICNTTALEEITKRPATSFIDAVASFESDGTWWLSPESAPLVAEAACLAQPKPILDWVTADEQRCREACKRGVPRTSLDGEEYTSSPDWEYRYYLQHERPVHELLRQWCGHRAVTFHERLAAAEAEIHRLDELIARAAGVMRDNKLMSQAAWLDEEHEQERITPFTVRPVVERPLDPNEIPVTPVYRRAWWR